MALVLHPTGRSPNGQPAVESPAYHVMEGDNAVGRIYQVSKRWVWAIYTLSTPARIAAGGSAKSLDDARKKFIEAWEAEKQSLELDRAGATGAPRSLDPNARSVAES
jgi:hypothetical protein